MSETVSIAGRAPWLADPQLQRLLSALREGGEEARIAGGAIRNALLGEAVTDIDIATTSLPDETMRRAKARGFKVVPTGYEHGTVTVVADRQSFEVTTLRADIETDGRRARVAFGRDWQADAERRDFTINALYADPDGRVVDLVGGLADLSHRRLRFIGDAEARVREDYLRILRFFRFFALYGSGRPDAEGLKACVRLKGGLAGLSAERVWSELRKLLSAPDPSRALLWMRQSGVLTAVLPESEKWGIDAIHGLVASERDLGWPPDYLVRLEAIVPPDPARIAMLCERLRLSGSDRDRLLAWGMAEPVQPGMSEAKLSQSLYWNGTCGVRDNLRLKLSGARARAAEDDRALFDAGNFSRLLAYADSWRKPVFPLAGADLAQLGFSPGKAMGDTLRTLEEAWVASGFALDRETLLSRAGAATDAAGPPGHRD